MKPVVIVCAIIGALSVGYLAVSDIFDRRTESARAEQERHQRVIQNLADEQRRIEGGRNNQGR